MNYLQQKCSVIYKPPLSSANDSRTDFSLFLTLSYPLTPPLVLKSKVQDLLQDQDNAVLFWWVSCVMPF